MKSNTKGRGKEFDDIRDTDSADDDDDDDEAQHKAGVDEV